ncbi:MAG TPA: DUF4089 domain-containing protein [Methylovirgula sp.]|nr:DUF4089 domain-containing protein [Methylovirgula sp.]
MDDEASLAAWCDAMAALLDLPIEAGDRAEIIANLQVIARQMKLVADFPLDDRAEPAPVFQGA